ncbi:MAG: hypothetical protein ACFFBQ_21095 [Promethearchaeota archaeon]
MSVNIAFVPTGTTTTCSSEVALVMVMNVQPQLIVPIHGNKQDLKQFDVLVKKVLSDLEVIVLTSLVPVKISLNRD